MNISYKWLKQYLAIDLTPDELTDKLTFSGIEVEAVHSSEGLLNEIKVAQIVKREAHPNSDHLSVCQVFDGKDTLQVVCGAPNCAENQKIAFAPVGTKIGEITIKRAKLRSVESFGMICSEKELGISDNHDGIMILAEDAKIGISLADHLNISDTVYEVEITPNRPDLLGMIGIARDLSAQLDLPLTIPFLKDIDKSKNDTFVVDIKEKELCTRYIANIIEGVTIGESPDWLKDCIIAAGVKPINNVVDITNYVMMEYAHPLHAFDYEKVEGKRILVRKSQAGEIINALDHNVYELTGEELVIADINKPLALAGIIGGMESRITDDTKKIVLEAACFNPSQIRRTSYKNKIYTDSSYRFERGTSNDVAEMVAKRASELIISLCGGKLTQTMIDNYPAPQEPAILGLRPARVKKLLTLTLENETIIQYLTALGLDFVKEEQDTLFFRVPSWRKDLEREIDLIEEIIRLHGYNAIESKPEANEITNKASLYLRRGLQDFLVTQGFYEVLNLSFSGPEDLDMINLLENDYRRNAIKLMNPQGTASSLMRTTLLPGLLNNMLFNLNHSQKDVRLFELNKVFFKSENKLGTEKWSLTGVLTGMTTPVYWKTKGENVEFFFVKGIVLALLSMFPVKKLQLQANTADVYYQPNMAVEVKSGKNIIATFGKLDPKMLLKYDIEEAVYSFDIDFTRCMELMDKKPLEFAELPKLAPVSRDLSFIISNEYPVSKLIEDIIQTNPKFIKEVVPFDEYKAKQIKAGYRSLSLNILIVPEIKNLTDEYINALICTIIEKLKQKYAIEMR